MRRILISLIVALSVLLMPAPDATSKGSRVLDDSVASVSWDGGFAYASGTQQQLLPGDTVRVTCSTTLSGAIQSSYADLACAPLPTPTPSPTPTVAPTATPMPPAWIEPRVTSLGHSVGYTDTPPYWGTYPGVYAFRCQSGNGGVWNGMDDDDVYAVVGLNDGPLKLGGLRGSVYGDTGQGAPTIEDHIVVALSNDGVNFHDVGHLEIVFPNRTVTPFVITWPVESARYLKWEVNEEFNSASWVVLIGLEVLAPAGAPRAC